MRKRFCRAVGALACCWLAFGQPGAAQEGIKAGNTSQYLGKGRWQWTLFIKAPPTLLNDISCVEYRLHSTFTEPLRRVCERGTDDRAFPLSANGWGTFEVPIKVFYKNGRTESLKYTLNFAPSKIDQALPIRAGNVATEIQKGLWKWTVYIEGPDEALNQIRCVQYTLHPTFPNPVREICERGTGRQAFPLTANGWGTFRIHIRVTLKNGGVQELDHDLKF